MGFKKKLLSRDEVVVRHMRTHPKVLLWNILGELLLIAVAVAVSIIIPDDWNPWGMATTWIIFTIVTVPLMLVPWLRWMTTTYTVTTRRVITRSGIFNKKGHDLPLTRISDVSYDRALTDRIFGCGTLILQTSANDPLVLDDIPAIEHVHVEMTDLLFHDVQGAINADPTDG
ncbi:PH domain-containing protein [Actinomyces vulturis]|uniref:PH domain-containing protein n=1 Tax=Actinomyces vulturis TaxID=1857645 RepID=UPI000836A193|nr:PH domain-containing protein [Actinomyces vulturis]